MDIKYELLTNEISELDFDAKQIADTKATLVVSEIQKILKTENISDFEIVDEIVTIFQKYNIDCGNCHDF